MVLQVVPGLEHPVLVAPGKEDQRSVGGGHVVEEDRDVHRARLRHLVVAMPGAEVLVPLPDLAVEGRLRVDLVLVHVHRAVDELHHRLDEARMAPEAAERLVVGVRGERGASHSARFSPDLLAVHRVDLVRGPPQYRRLLGREAGRKEQVALFVESCDLFGRQPHDESPRAFVVRCATWRRDVRRPRSARRAVVHLAEPRRCTGSRLRSGRAAAVPEPIVAPRA